MNKIVNFYTLSFILISGFIGFINYDTLIRDVKFTHLSCQVDSNDSIEFQIYFDEKHKIMYYSDDFTAMKGGESDSSISPSTIKYHQDRTFNDGKRTPIRIFYEIDRPSLKFNRFIETPTSRTKPDTGTCTINNSHNL